MLWTIPRSKLRIHRNNPKSDINIVLIYINFREITKLTSETVIVLTRVSRPIDRRIKHWNIFIWLIVSYKEAGEQAEVKVVVEEEEEGEEEEEEEEEYLVKWGGGIKWNEGDSLVEVLGLDYWQLPKISSNKYWNSSKRFVTVMLTINTP